MVRIFSNKSETCVLFGATEDKEQETLTCKLLVLFPEAPFPATLYEIFPDGTDRYQGQYQIHGTANANQHRMFRNVVFYRHRPDTV